MKPHLVTTLLVLAQIGRERGRIVLTTRDLARKLSISQQTSSRYLVELERRGLIVRGRARRGEEITITSQGFKELSPLYLSLKKIFEPPLKEMVLTGEVVSGLGEGAYYVSKPEYKRQFTEKLGFTPFPGTLNVRLRERGQRDRILLDLFEPIMIEGFDNGERSFGQVKCYRALLNDTTRCVVVTALRTHYREDILEVIAEPNLRKSLGLKDGDRVTVKIARGSPSPAV